MYPMARSCAAFQLRDDVDMLEDCVASEGCLRLLVSIKASTCIPEKLVSVTNEARASRGLLIVSACD